MITPAVPVFLHRHWREIRVEPFPYPGCDNGQLLFARSEHNICTGQQCLVAAHNGGNFHTVGAPELSKVFIVSKIKRRWHDLNITLVLCAPGATEAELRAVDCQAWPAGRGMPADRLPSWPRC